MGTWSTALFGNDIALDVQANYMHYLRSGLSDAKASRQIIADYEGELVDEYEASIVWCALAATQWKVGRLQSYVRNKALRAIKRGGDLPRWEEENTPREVGSRRRVLNNLRKKLESDPPPRKKIKLNSPEPALTKTVKSPWTKGEVIAFETSPGKLALLLVEGLRTEDGPTDYTYFSLLDWNGSRVPTANKIQKLELLLDSAAIASVESDPIPWHRIKQPGIKRRGRGNLYMDEHGVGGFQSSKTWDDLPKWIRKTRTKKRQAYLAWLR